MLAVTILLLELTITPAAIAAATLLGRRFGPGVGGWFVAIPFTSAPVVLFLALDHGAAFAGDTAVGILGGTASQAGFALLYAWAATRLRWPVALAAGTAGFAAVTFALDTVHLTVPSALEIAVGTIVFSLALIPRAPALDIAAIAERLPIAVDVAVRAVLATAVVVTVTSAATRLGPMLAGLLSPYPLFGAMFMAIPHHRQGGAAAIAAARGLLWGLFATCGFFAMLGILLPVTSLALAYVVAAAVVIVLQAVTLTVLRHWRAGTRREPA